jgi:beta-N-acetylhexosaminidase
MRRAILIVIMMAAAVLAAPPPRKPAAPAKPAMEMTLREKIAQLIIAPCYGENPNAQSADYRKFVHWVRDLKVGGLIVLNRVVYGNVRNAEPFAMAAFLNQMQRLSKTPLLIGADLERGASMRVANTTKFPHNMAFGAARDLNATRQEGATVARESRALGIHWVFAPVADVNNNPENPVIGTRSFGERATDVATHVEAYIDGARSDPRNRVLVCVKHFPGHGDTSMDSHYGLGTISGDRKRLDEVELVPFRSAIRKGVDGVMTAHLTVPAIEPEEIPATVSEPVLTGLLRKELGFQGLIVTDAMDMAGLTKMFPPGEAAVRALLAGVDVLLMPSNPDAVINAVAKAVQEGRLSEKRIDRSVSKIIGAKTRLGLFQKRTVDLETIHTVLESPGMDAVAQATADRAVTMVRNDKDVFPLASSDSAACLYVLTESRRNTLGLRLMDEVRARDPKLKTVMVDSALPETALNDLLPPAAACKSVIVAAFNGGSKLHPALDSFVNKILAGPAPVGLVALGNPYLLQSFPSVAGYLATYSNTPTAELAAVKALFGEIKLNGRLPVTIPGIANYGDGIQMPARSTK